MGVSLVGIITTQIIWIKNSVAVRDEMFDHAVHDALQATSRRLDNQKRLETTQRVLSRDSIVHIRKREIRKAYKNIRKDKAFSDLFNKTQQNNTPREDFDYGGIKQDTTYSIYLPDSHSKDDNSSDINITITDNSENIDAHFDNFSTVAGQQFDLLESFAAEMVTEIDQWHKGRSIDPNLIEQVLSKELKHRGVDTNFEYSILHNRTIVKSSPEMKDFKDAYYAPLYPNDIFSRNIQIAVKFPDRDIFIASLLRNMLLLSIIFLIIILATFGLSLYTIFNQKRLSQMQNDFVNNMTHEFKTPIATISVASDSIASPLLATDHSRVVFFTGIIKKETIRMNEHIEKILRIARFERAESSMNLSIVDANEVIDKIVESISLQVQSREGTIIFNPEAQNPNITTDRIHFQGVINNIIDNALKYSEGRPHITVTTINVAKGVQISVKDRGIGMSKTVQSKVFDRFYRQTTGNIHNVKGFGLGLSYVKEIVKSNQGEIKVSSEVGEGSEFTLFLPYTME